MASAGDRDGRWVVLRPAGFEGWRVRPTHGRRRCRSRHERVRDRRSGRGHRRLDTAVAPRPSHGPSARRRGRRRHLVGRRRGDGPGPVRAGIDPRHQRPTDRARRGRRGGSGRGGRVWSGRTRRDRRSDRQRDRLRAHPGALAHVEPDATKPRHPWRRDPMARGRQHLRRHLPVDFPRSRRRPVVPTEPGPRS